MIIITINIPYFYAFNQEEIYNKQAVDRRLHNDGFF